MSNFLQQNKDAYNFYKNKELQKEFNDKLVQKTGYYQKKFGFETNPRKGHEFWNVEADAFKHAFGSTEMYLKYGNVWSTAFDIGHEYRTPHNPQGEWNMDSWNNNQGREIAREIQKEYGDNFMKLSQQQRNDIIAVKVMNRMRNGQLITNPNDRRKYTGIAENFVNGLKSIQESKIPYTPTRSIGGVMPNGLPTGFATPVGHIYTREDLRNMSKDEFVKNEKAIMKQLKERGIPTRDELEKQKSSSRGRSNSDSDSDGGHWVTINGNHVLMKD